MYDIMEFCGKLINYSLECNELGKQEVRFVKTRTVKIPTKDPEISTLTRKETKLRIVGHELEEGFANTSDECPGFLFYVQAYEGKSQHPTVDSLVSMLMKERADSDYDNITLMFEEEKESGNTGLYIDDFDWEEYEDTGSVELTVYLR